MSVTEFDISWWTVVDARTSSAVFGGGGNISTNSTTGEVRGSPVYVGSVVFQDLRLRSDSGQESTDAVNRSRLLVMTGHCYGIVRDQAGKIVARINRTTREHCCYLRQESATPFFLTILAGLTVLGYFLGRNSAQNDANVGTLIAALTMALLPSFVLGHIVCYIWKFASVPLTYFPAAPKV
jgi:hypothetical protein